MELESKNDQAQKIRYCFNGISGKNARPSNMDSLIILEKVIGQDRLILAVVSDGVGSLDQGSFASTAVSKGLLKWFSTLESSQDVANLLHIELLAISSDIYTQTQAKGFKSATTATVLLIVNSNFYTFNAGDSRIYLCRDGQLQQLTRDDVSETGALTEYLGYQRPPRLSRSQGSAVGGAFLLCSDGLYRKMNPDFLFGKLEECCEANIDRCLEELADFVIQRGETDNISLAIIKDCTKAAEPVPET